MPESAKIQFTPAQSAAITARGGSLLVSAAAGSGKTRVLVERVVGLATDPIHPVEADSLLIMTFTNAAAAKLRGGHHHPPGRGSARPPRRHAPAPPAIAIAAGSHRHGGCLLPAFCAAALCRAGCAAGLYHRRGS